MGSTASESALQNSLASLEVSDISQIPVVSDRDPCQPTAPTGNRGCGSPTMTAASVMQQQPNQKHVVRVNTAGLYQWQKPIRHFVQQYAASMQESTAETGRSRELIWKKVGQLSMPHCDGVFSRRHAKCRSAMRTPATELTHCVSLCNGNVNLKVDRSMHIWSTSQSGISTVRNLCSHSSTTGNIQHLMH